MSDSQGYPYFVWLLYPCLKCWKLIIFNLDSLQIWLAHFLMLENNVWIIRIKHFSSKKNLSSILLFQGYLFESGIPIFKWKVTWNYNNSPFKIKNLDLCIAYFKSCLNLYFYVSELQRSRLLREVASTFKTGPTLKCHNAFAKNACNLWITLE